MSMEEFQAKQYEKAQKLIEQQEQQEQQLRASLEIFNIARVNYFDSLDKDQILILRAVIGAAANDTEFAAVMRGELSAMLRIRFEMGLSEDEDPFSLATQFIKQANGGK